MPSKPPQVLPESSDWGTSMSWNEAKTRWLRERLCPLVETLKIFSSLQDITSCGSAHPCSHLHGLHQPRFGLPALTRTGLGERAGCETRSSRPGMSAPGPAYVPGGRPDPGSWKCGGRPCSWTGLALWLRCCSLAEGRFQSHCPECRWRLQNLGTKFRPTESTERKGDKTRVKKTPRNVLLLTHHHVL